MSNPLQEMTDAEFFGEAAKVISMLCNRIASAHNILAQVFEVHPNDIAATAMLMHSAYPVMEGLGNICNGIDLADDSEAELTAPVFHELQKRHREYIKPHVREVIDDACGSKS